MSGLTICVATHDRWELLNNALNGLLCQTITVDSIIVVDDRSRVTIPDYTEQLLENSTVSYCRHKENSGLAAARNTAIALTETKYFAFCDDDDQWPPCMTERLLSRAESSPDSVGVVLAFPESKRPALESYFETYPTLRDVMRRGITPPVGAQLYRTQLLKEIGGYDARVRSGVDHDLWVSLAKPNPRVAATFGAPVMVGSEPDRDRMTTNESKRRSGIEEALQIWRPRIIEAFSEDFYQHLVSSYRGYLDDKFFTQAIKNKQYADASRRAFAKPRVATRLATRLGRRLLRQPAAGNLFPPFPVVQND